MQRSLLRIGGPTLCVVLTLGLLMAGKSAITGAESTAVPEMTLETPDLSDVPTIGEDPAVSADVPADPDTEAMPFSPDVQKPEGDVTPVPVPEPPAVDSESLAPPGEVPVDPATLEETILRHPVALSAGLVQFEGRTIQIAGVKPQSADRICRATTGDWPCGTVARTAFRNFIRARAFTCQTPKGGWSGTVTARCTVGTDDPALWLAHNGWAEVDGDDTALTAAVASAKTTAKGFYRAGTEPSPPSQGLAP
ncbi:hypothetical protein DFI02_101860 [Rhizobium sp. PP-F2F-G20b]|nr:hypothetical protein DFI02_101860 [Rhizobium sp. PP-F2F-G20b]